MGELIGCQALGSILQVIVPQHTPLEAPGHWDTYFSAS